MKNPFLLILFLFCYHLGNAQISTFPYLQNFESSNGGWTSGGTGDDWAWGHPNKSIINQAGGGQKCWITGGLTGSSYTNGERSYLESPIFNFSSLSNPYLEFKMYVETEQGYDGASLQYSTNNGSTWINVGAVNEPNNCFTNQWFNTTSIMYLTGLSSIKEGWSGNSRSSSGGCAGGGGTMGWVVSKHCLKFLAGIPQVQFRFIFGAGTSCNTFDGFAFDDFSVKNAPTLGARFTYTCVTPGNFRFTDNSPNCPNQWNWNFGDGTTGSGNVITHSFSPGKYQVQLISANACSQPDTSTIQIPVLGIQTRAYPVSCFGGNDGKGKAFFTGIDSAKSWNISWNTTPAISSTDSINGLKAGNYQVTITQNGTCSVSSNIQITEPPALTHLVTSIPTVCLSSKGSIDITENGGTPPYQFKWTPSISNSNLGKNIPAAAYTVVISDAKNCRDTVNTTVISQNRMLPIYLGKDTIICPEEGPLTLYAGAFQAYQWSDGSTNSSISLNTKGFYHVIVSDTDGCVGSDTLEVREYCSEEMWIPTAFSPDEDGWNDDFGGLTSSPKKLGSYTLMVFDRWGQQMFLSNRYEDRWNGTINSNEVPPGTYPYLLLYQFPGKNPQTKKGLVTVVK